MSSPSPRRSVESFEFFNSPPPQHNQFPFPQHDWTHRSSSTGRFQPRRGSTASSIHSVGGVLDTSFQTRMGSVRESGQNAISTLLQPPIVRTGMLPHTSASAASTHRPPSTKDIPPVTLTNITHVEPTAFNTYLSKVGALYDVFQRAKAEAEGGSQPTARKVSGKKDGSVDTLEKDLQVTPFTSPAIGGPVGSPFSPIGTPQPKRRSSAGRRLATAVTPLSTIPPVYFDENFHLENPRTFDIVSERSEVVRPTPAKSGDARGIDNSLEPPKQPERKALATNAILQEKLSWYMDTVEVHLISSISTASSSFFAALGSLRELESEASESVVKIKALRDDLSKLDRQMAVGGLKIVEMKRRRENLRKLVNAVDQLQCVIQALSHCEELVDKGDLDVALARLDIVELLISGSSETTNNTDFDWFSTPLPPVLIDLRSLKALDGVSQGIQQLMFRVGKGFEARFLETLLSDLRQHVQTVKSQDTLARWIMASQRSRGDHARTGSILPAYINTSNQFRSDLRADLMGLSASGSTGTATSAFREAILREMKILIRRHLPSSTDEDAESGTSVSTRSSRVYSQQDKNSILARNLKAMDPADAEQFFINIYTDIGEALRRLSVQVKVLLDVTSGVTSPTSGGLRSPPKSPNVVGLDGYLSRSSANSASADLQAELMQALDLSSLLGQAVDAAQAQITKLLKVRSEATASLPLDRFLRFFNLNRLFADECEAISSRSGTALKGIVNNNILDFVSRFADIEKQQLAQTMDADRWEAKDFDAADNAVLQRILQGMTKDPIEWHQVGSFLSKQNEAVNGNSAGETNGSTGEKPKTTPAAIIDEERYIIPGSAGTVLRGIDRFETLCAVIPTMTSEVASSLCDYLKFFNSRLCQLILGAGAMQTAGLKRIYTKHLAIASQTLSFVIAVLPYIRECARRHASGTKPPLGEFDNVKRLLQDQQVSIHDKIVDILSNSAVVHVRNLQKIDWDSDAERQISPNMEILIKDTMALYKVITKFLPEHAIRMIMDPIFQSYREQLGKVFKEAPVKTASGKQRLLRDAQLFGSKLSHINGAASTGGFLIQLAEAKLPSQDEIHANKQPGSEKESTQAPTEKAAENS